MAGKLTFTMVKPEAVAKHLTGAILQKIQQAGFVIKALKMYQLTQKDAEAFYAVHQDKPFFADLTAYMSSGPIVAVVLEKENAISDFRALIGATDPKEAAEGTLRKLFAESKSKNAVHGADSDENALIEIAFHFAQTEIF